MLALQHFGSWDGPSAVVAFEDNENAEQVETLLDFDDVLVYSLAFHPDYEKNGLVYLAMNGPLDRKVPRTTRVVCYTVDREPPRGLDPKSKTPIIEWPSDGHNGCDVTFSSHDGFLYITSGDGSNDYDEHGNGQNLGTLLSSVLRIDVDHPSEGRAYSTPADNPFVDTPGARPEIWAYGLRNPWRMYHDGPSDQLWVGNNGQDNWEQVYLVRSGQNCGWAVVEGSHPFNLEAKRGPTPIVGPVIDHGHGESRSLTGGRIYHGKKLPGLRGAYLYGDFVTGKIWGLHHDGEKLLWSRELVDTALKVTYFGVDHQGELLVADHGEGDLYAKHENGKLFRLVENDATDTSSAFPRTLGQTGLFRDVEKHEVEQGVVPYEVTVPQWSGAGRAERFIGLPGDATMEWTKHGSWKLPDGSVVIKTLSVKRPGDDPDAWRRVETQMLYREEDNWAGYTYEWNEEGTDATLVEGAGKESWVEVADTESEGGLRKTLWRFSSRAECMTCHSRAAGFLVGLSSSQLNHVVSHGGKQRNQLELFEERGLLKNLGEPKERLTLVDPRDKSHDLEARARSFLHANCKHCHVMSGGGNAYVVLTAHDSLEKHRLLDARPYQNDFGLTDARILAPGDPARSVLYYRLSTMGSGHMPPIRSDNVDFESIKVIREWIASMETPEGTDPATLQGRAKVTATLDRLCKATALDEASRADVSTLLESTSATLALLDAVEDGRLSAPVRAAVLESATSHGRPQSRDLFERFVAPENRKKRLGPRVDPQVILALSGDAQRGRKLFQESAVAQCKSCHRFGEGKPTMGPDLSKIGGKLDRERILESILEPSKTIEPEFVSQLVVTATGDTHTGVLVDQSADEIVLRDAKNEEIRVSRAQVLQMSAQDRSAMPTGLVENMTAQELADLVAFLAESK